MDVLYFINIDHLYVFLTISQGWVDIIQSLQKQCYWHLNSMEPKGLLDFFNFQFENNLQKKSPAQFSSAAPSVLTIRLL